MSASTWLVPLNIHHSLSLRTVAKNSRQLQNISTSIYALTRSLQSLEKTAFEIAGSTNKILSLLESKEHKESTIAAMRMLIFRHQQTCSEAINEEDKLSAISSCIISEKLLNQEWFNLDLFSHASFEEMKKADEILRNCSNIIDSLRDNLSTEEAEMVDKLPDFLRRISEIENSSKNIKDSLLGLFNVDNVDLYDFAQNEIWDSKNREHRKYNMIQINGKGLNSFPNAMGIIKQLIDDEGVGETLEKITFNDSEITRVSKEASNNPYFWGSEFDIQWYQKKFSEKASATRKLKMDVGKLKKRSSDSSKISEKLVKEMNEAFEGRLTIGGIMHEHKIEEMMEKDLVAENSDWDIYSLDIRKISIEIENETDEKFAGVDESLVIDESISEHYTQILFLIREMCYPVDLVELQFSRDELMDSVRNNFLIHRDSMIFDDYFIDELPEKIDSFIRNYCIVEENIIVEGISYKLIKKIRPTFLSFQNFLYEELSVNSEDFHGKSVSDEDTLRILLEDIDENDWWTVAFEGPVNEHVQWGQGDFEYWKDEEMILQLPMSKSEAIEKLFEEYLI
jgi:hypothetical protein